MLAFLASTAAPATLCLSLAYLLRGQAGRHTTGMTRPDAPYTNPLPEHVAADVRRRAVRRFEDRVPFVNGVNTGVTA